MAQGKVGTGLLVTIAVVMTLSVSTGAWNPFPDLWNWIYTSGPVSDPAAKWQERLGGPPQTVTLLERYVVVEQRDSVEVRSRFDGKSLWKTASDWAAVAGPPERTVVVSGKLLTKGYEVRNPATGQVLRRDNRASAVWTYSDAMLDVSCRAPTDCELTAREPASGDELWRVGLPGIGFVLFADNPKLRQLAPMTANRVEESTRVGPMPPVLGFPVDGKVQVVDTVAGRVLAVLDPDRRDFVQVLGGRIVHSVASPREGGCTLKISGIDAGNGNLVWAREGYQLKTLSGGACEQRNQPTGGGNAVLALRPDGREVLLDAWDGREVLVAGDKEHILATDGVTAVVRSGDGAFLIGYLLGKADPLWKRKADSKATAAVTGGLVVICDRSPDRTAVLAALTGKVRLEVRSSAKVAAVDESGLLLTERRDLGYLALTG